jgi:16S rRNA (adenine1518-N6/adenine1519-N6)-dimethyltransferase
MKKVFPQKSFGQHFLRDEEVLFRIVEALNEVDKGYDILEIGPGMGALTAKLLPAYGERFRCVEVDDRCVAYLESNFPQLRGKIIHADFLKLNLREILQQPTIIIGNFPYNISTQIIWQIFDHHDQIPFLIGMFQKEVAQRLVSAPGTKVYGIQSVMTALFYKGELLFDIPPEAFEPPPKVMSTVIRLGHHQVLRPGVNAARLKMIVKIAFNQRRKMLRNGLSGVLPAEILQQPLFEKRAEQLSLEDFIYLSEIPV